MAEQGKDQREFERYMLQFGVEIYDAATGMLIETARLKDVSGSGIRFLSTHPDAYVPGQEISLVIRLPGTDTMAAHMYGHGAVVWIAGKPEHGEAAWPIGVNLSDPLRFGQEWHRTSADDDTGGDKE